MNKASLYRFLNLVDGSWRNAIYLECGVCPYGLHTCGDHLLAVDHDGTPVLYSVTFFQQVTGEHIDRSECAAVLHRSAFERLYSKWLFWHLPRSYRCHIRQLTPQPDEKTICQEVL